MAISTLILALFLQTAQTKSLACISLQDKQTTPLRSAAGFTAVLKMHSEDEHGKNTHLCETAYTLQIWQPDGTASTPFNFSSADDNWGRAVAFRIEGSSTDGNRVFAFISEGRYPAWIETVEFDMRSGARTQDIFLDRHFTRRLSRACAATLHHYGLSSSGLIVLASSAKDGCAQSQLWQLRPNKYKGGATTGGLVLPEYPDRLASDVGVILNPAVEKRAEQ
jgi:hypothetical protein